jgi:menaquinone-9 beta-reductase
MCDQVRSTSCDVTVIGVGLAGKAASLHLARAGLKVVCLEPRQAVRPPVGESLDWSAPDLLNRLGISPESLLESRIATWKRHVILKMRDGCDVHYVPSAWLGGPPFYVNLATLHVERTQLDDEILKMVLDQGVMFVQDRVVDLDTADGKIRSVETESGARFSSPWFIDASGIGASLAARKFNLPSLQYGPTKVAIWSYFKVAQQVEGTTLYMDPGASEYLEWIWEIPVSPDTVSVGYVAPGEAVKAKRDGGQSVEELFRQQIMKFSRFEPLVAQGALGAGQRDCVPVPGLHGICRSELADCRRGCVSRRSHHFQRSYRCASARGRGCGACPEIPDARRTILEREESLRQPDCADGEVF